MYIYCIVQHEALQLEFLKPICIRNPTKIKKTIALAKKLDKMNELATVIFKFASF